MNKIYCKLFGSASNSVSKKKCSNALKHQNVFFKPYFCDLPLFLAHHSFAFLWRQIQYNQNFQYFQQLAINTNINKIGYLQNYNFQRMENSDEILNQYEKIRFLDQGSYGMVYLYKKVQDKKNTPFNSFFYCDNAESEYFALKKYKINIINNKYGIDFTALREINILTTMKHKNIASCYEVIYKKDIKNHQTHHNVYIVMDFHLQLTEVVSKPLIVRSLQDKKNICYQITQGLSFLHSNYIFHRDLKPGNIFVSRSGYVKLSDFGGAKEFGSPHRKFTLFTCTKQYRAPQVFFGTHYYTEKSDIWSLGCIIAYIFTNKNIFKGESDSQLQVLGNIFSIRGTPNQHNWPSYHKFPRFCKFSQTQPKDLKKYYQFSQQIAQIVEACLQLDPRKRPSAQQLLKHNFFRGVEIKPFNLSDYFDEKIHDLLQSANKTMEIEEQF